MSVNIRVELNKKEAEALAEFTKRVGFKECLDNAVDEDEAYLMRNALQTVRQVLADNGFNPR